MIISIEESELTVLLRGLAQVIVQTMSQQQKTNIMSVTQSDLDALESRLRSKQAEEKTQVASAVGGLRAALEEVRAQIARGVQPPQLDLSGLESAVESTSTIFEPSETVEGKHFVALGWSSVGSSQVRVLVEYANEDEDIIPIAESIYQAGVAAAASQPAGGYDLDTTLFITVDGVTRTTKVASLHPKIKADIAIAEAIKSIATAQALEEGI